MIPTASRIVRDEMSYGFWLSEEYEEHVKKSEDFIAYDPWILTIQGFFKVSSRFI